MEKIKKENCRLNKKTLFVAVLAIAIFLLGAFFRLWQLETIPPGLQYDEAYNGRDALNASRNNDYRLFYPDNNGREGLFLNAISLSLDFFGINNFGIRFPSAFVGTLTLIGFFFLARELRLSWFSTIMGTFMMTFSFWHLNFSRLSYRAIMTPFLLVWIFFFFYRGLRTKKYYYFILSGLLTGIGFHTYIAFRVAPLIFFILCFFLILLNAKFFKTYWKGALIFIASAAIAAAPIFVYFVQHPTDFTGRSDSVSVFNAPDMSFPEAFGRSLTYHLGSFFIYGDPNQRHNHNGMPLLPPAWGVLFAFGLVISFKEIIATIVGKFKKTRSCRLCHASILGQSIFWVMLIPGVMSIEGIPHALRIIGTIPGVFLISILPLEYLLKMYNRLKISKFLSYKLWRWTVLKISMVGLTTTIILAGISQVYIYFGPWAHSPATAQALERELFDFGKVVHELEKKQNNFIIVSQEVGIFDEGKSSALKTTEFSGQPEIQEYFFYHSLEGLTKIPCDNSQIVFQQADSWLRDQYQKKCPQLSFQQYLPKNGMYSFWVMK